MRAPFKEVRGLLIAVLAGAAFTYGLRYFGSVGTRIERTPVVEAVLEDAEAPRISSAGADVTMVIFTDYQCPNCRIANRAMQKILAEDRRVQVIFKDWPIFGKASKEAARVAIASDMQGIYAKVHDRMMRQTGRLDQRAMRTAVEAAGGDWPRLVRDRNRDIDRIDALIARNSMQAFSLGLGGTPGYLIGPVLVRGALDERGFRKALAQARKTEE
jgi:protein-disulfide isomerase